MYCDMLLYFDMYLDYVLYLSCLSSKCCVQDVGEDRPRTKKCDSYISVKHLYAQGREPALQSNKGQRLLYFCQTSLPLE